MKIATIKNFGLFTSPFTGNTMRKTNPRKIDYFEFEYIFTAKGTFYLDNKVYDIQDNMILVKKPNQIAYSCFSIKCFYLYIELDKSSEFYDFLMNISSFYSIIDPTVYNRIFQDLIKHLTITNNPEDDYINSKLLELFYFLKIDEDKNRTISKS